MGLYRHIGSSDELRHAALDAALMQVGVPASEGSVHDRLWDWSVATRRVLRRYPGLSEACLTEWVSLRHGCRMMEGLLWVVRDHTADDGEQVAIANAVFVYVLSRVVVERAVLAAGRRRSLPAVDAEPRRFENLRRVQSRFSTINVDSHFEIGLDALLSGLLDSSAQKRQKGNAAKR